MAPGDGTQVYVPRSLPSIAALALIGLIPLVGPVDAKRPSVVDRFFQQWDADHDGTLGLDEVKKAASEQFDDRHAPTP
jgi:hypothetical protein